ncbi:MAG: choice-of-anchor Q domain-containing protein [Pyrinomonadaceae bacterium]
MNKKIYIVIGALFFMLSLAVMTRAAITLTVTRTDDRNNATCVQRDCSLREAITAANAGMVDNEIRFALSTSDPNCNATAQVCKITLSNEIVISSAGTLIINGTGANHLIIDGGAGINRIFTIYSTVTINDVTLQGGNGSGGSSVTNGKGNAIYANGAISGSTLTLNGVVVQNNLDTFFTGGNGSVYFFGGTNPHITNSTFTGNSNANCGAFTVEGATLTVTNTTVSGNTASTAVGGGVCALNSGTAVIRSSTIANNSAFNIGGGIVVSNGTLDLGNTIVAGNTGGSYPDIYANGAVTTIGGNIIGNNSDVASIFPFGTNLNKDRVGNSTAPLDALLAPLGNYGGSTPTRAIFSTSPANYNGVSIFGGILPTDQRGAPRNIITFDTGAFELNGTTFFAILPPPIINQPYSQTITPNSNGNDYCISSGGLPPGLSGIPGCLPSFAKGNVLFSPQVLVAITGTPTLPGTYNFAVKTSSGANSLTTNYQITVNAPTAASASVSGQVMESNGKGIFRARVTLTDMNGETQITLTNPFGFYLFNRVPAGETYIISVAHKRYQFINSPQVLNILEDTNDVNFTAEPLF